MQAAGVEFKETEATLPTVGDETEGVEAVRIHHRRASDRN